MSCLNVGLARIGDVTRAKPAIQLVNIGLLRLSLTFSSASCK